MKRPFSATVWSETEEEALANLKEALELHLEPPLATRPAEIRTIEVEVGAA
jgi:predicted RNase H-like HicB family nuclease